ncbi:LacI family DNA-binding transcriptional regulator [Brachybacterium sp. AOP43-C2-M15]|uniref:LacI family DNA-binding transcriptional regulator n=1 Tax=Brachybacterium sp. AOP43-C2-M15 TaxID=3457661 RepID=UPI0040348D78
MARKRPTMKDVAARAGVGFKTVSRVVNGEPGVSEQTAERVHRAAAELNYRRDMIAGNLRRAEGRTDSLGLLVASVRNEFDAVMNRAVEDAAQRHRTSVFTGSTDEDPERERQHARGLLSRRVDGLVLMPSHGDLSYLQPEIDLDTPIVAVDRPPHGIEVDTVMADNAQGARDAVAHLVDHGHRRVAVLTHLGTLTTAAQRIAGARSAWADAGLPECDLRIVDGLTSEQEIVRAVLGLLDGEAPPTAVFAARNQITTGAVRALQTRGLQREVALVGFDDFEHADLFDPAISVVGQDPARLGHLATERLFARLADPSLPVEHQVLETSLILRRSCGCEG